MTLRIAGFTAFALFSTTAAAEVKFATPDGFLVERQYHTSASAEKAWALLGHPEKYWPKEHTWSGDPANLSLKMAAGGCFCERWKGGEAEHGRVVMARTNELLRINGAFGPMQDMAVTGVVSVALKAAEAGTDITVSYRVSGTAAHQLDKLAPVVDSVVGVQFGNWVDKTR
ncbi:hypothetical protein [Tahibacter amnicola]|uniref:Polyketide cyclase/dehydrase/lipid transport protein n=1 Tax=Tahibacter amnicola TaxID=2976241 RepID=A0ABY6BK23_9GAMM|nr:hypothetical protein [Tahibacter amnicola]UXI68142.1 hypothetical protein N4264_00370 [Tahibacter amnicola]